MSYLPLRCSYWLAFYLYARLQCLTVDILGVDWIFQQKTSLSLIKAELGLKEQGAIGEGSNQPWDVVTCAINNQKSNSKWIQYIQTIHPTPQKIRCYNTSDCLKPCQKWWEAFLQLYCQLMLPLKTTPCSAVFYAWENSSALKTNRTPYLAV